MLKEIQERDSRETELKTKLMRQGLELDQEKKQNRTLLEKNNHLEKESKDLTSRLGEIAIMTRLLDEQKDKCKNISSLVNDLKRDNRKSKQINEKKMSET